jgi:hypothetical protein
MYYYENPHTRDQLSKTVSEILCDEIWDLYRSVFYI